LLKKNTNPFSFIKTSLFVAGNTRTVNLFLFLFAVSYFIVGADLCKEMAKENDEIGFFTATLANSVHVDNSAILSLLERVPQQNEILPSITYYIHSTNLVLFPPGRSPPEPA